MKKIFTLIALAMFTGSVFADDIDATNYIVDGEEVTTVGETDNSSTWWTAFSSYYRIPTESTLTLSFTNHTSGAYNWNNWLLVLTTDDVRDGSDYAEYLVLRSDNYGWGDYYIADSLSSNFNWDSFLTDMEGCEMKITITRSGSNVSIYADYNSGTYYESIGFDLEDTSVIRAFLTTELGYLENVSSSLTLSTSDTETGISSISAENSDAAAYNLSGQKVSSSYKGVVIKNGVKVIQK